jgi:hypothetical protein
MKGSATKNTPFLLPYSFKMAGFLAILPGFILIIIRFYFDIKLSLFDIKTFAIYSTYLQTKYFSIIDNHFTEEIGGFLLLIGIMFIVLSRENDEKPEFNQLRLKAFILSFYTSSIFLMVTVLFVFGIAFVKIILFGSFLPFLVYYSFFKYFLFRYRNNLQANQNEIK